MNVTIEGGDGWWIEYLRIKTEKQEFDCPYNEWIDDTIKGSIFVNCNGKESLH